MAFTEPEGTSRDHAARGDKAIADDAPTVLQPSPSDYEKSRPMKHLTCFFWFHYKCKYSEPNCLYAHWETGHIASAPCQVEPGHSIAGGNLQNYLNHQQAVFKDHRSAQGLSQESRGDPVTSRRRSTLDPVIQQQIDNITAKVQKQHFLESYTMFTYQNQHNPMFTDFINSTTPEEVWNARPWGPLGSQADVTPYPSAAMRFSPEQASPGIFSPTPQQTGHAQPVSYSLPAPPASIYAVNHDDREQKHQELHPKLDNAQAEIERLRKANSTLVKALIGTVCVSELNATDVKKSCQMEGLKLAILAKRLSKLDQRRNTRDVVDARDVALAVANAAANNFDKSALHLRELAHAKSLVHEAIAESGNEEALALWDARKGTWPFEDRFWRR